MVKKLALFLGVLLLLAVADLQVKANETTIIDLRNRENSFEQSDRSNNLNSVVNHSEDRTKTDKVKAVGKGKLGEERKLKRSQIEQRANKGPGDDQTGNEKIVGVDRPEEKALPGDPSGESKNEENEKSGLTELRNEGKTDQGIGLERDLEGNENEPDSNSQSDSKEDQNVLNEGSNNSKFGGDECYSSIRCTDKDNKLIACLRVPGNELSPLSLLIQNKGNNSLTVDIYAPEFVHLETTKVQLQQKENKKVEVSLGNGGTESLIMLTSGDQICSLDLKDLMSSSHNYYKYLNLAARRPSLAFMSFSALLLMASALTFLTFLRRKLSGTAGFAYQRVDDMALPVTGTRKPRSLENEGWDESWGDGWDDEETPQTASKPSPTASSKRLAARRLSKENWKA